ncbi:hypothetical protein C8A00DRAFT_40534 [Chaetomidium leptoderma]|uniref:G patch domain-containing protein n=1 Tax=Chaetomidium leptoderma TaxID=669021 RepID=A0AAN6VSL7_9PEZI|nr:hypothetical protein C8A00DRAFT_40534 [Chaetomidium leptoderma]
MSYKRSRATYEADLTAQQSPYVLFGTALPPLDPEVRDDGSYVPLWKQEVRDERGRKRLHGAFTGGWSAGYFNTVGSKEGWAPSTFVSSRTSRRKDDPKAAEQRAEDFMDEEDLADAEESKRIQTQAAFSGLGTTADDATRASETMGAKLLRRMGKARLDLGSDPKDAGGAHLFAPENVSMISFVRKTDHKGLGYAGETRLTPINRSARTSGANDSDEDDDGQATGRKKEREKSRGGIGIGILNDTGSDDEDPYEIGGDKRKKKATTSINPTLKTKPAFIPSKKSALGKVALGVRKCHDGRLPLEGFIFGKGQDALTSETNAEGKYPPPKIPPGWVSAKQPKSQADAAGYVSTADAAKASTLDPKLRAAILGEKQLPGKSVFDFMSADARERLASATGKQDLPPARGEVPAGYALSEADRLQELLGRVPELGKETAVAAISRGAGGNAPYKDDEAKRSRYISFLEYEAGFKPTPGTQPPKMNNEEWLREMHEFYNCARIFKPMTGFMASRFTTSTTTKPSSGSGGETEDKDLISKPPPKPQDPAEEAAKLGMFGPLTRSVTDFYPTRLLCKRFNVKPPQHVQPDDYPAAGPSKPKYDASSQFGVYREHDPLRQEPPALELGSVSASASTPGDSSSTPAREEATSQKAAAPETAVVDSSRNEALEGKRAGEDVFKDIFGDSIPEPPDTVAETNPLRFTAEVDAELRLNPADNQSSPPRQLSPPPQYPASEASGTAAFRPPPSFSSLFPTQDHEASGSVFEPCEPYKAAVSDTSEEAASAAPAYAPHDQVAPESSNSASAALRLQDETKRVLPQDTKGQAGSSSKDEDAEPPPAYSEGSSPLHTFTYLMAAAGGASSIITQVQQGGPSLNPLGDVPGDETILMDLRGTRFTLSRDELLTLPEFVLLSLFPNGLFPEGHMGGFTEGEAVQVDYDPASLQYMLDFFRNVAQSIPAEGSGQDGTDGLVPLDPSARDENSKRAGIIVLREDLDFYVIPPKQDIEQPEMVDVKRAASRALLRQDGIFSGLKKSDEPGTTEAHLIEMLTAGGFNHEDHWGHRAGEPNKAVICSLALARLRSDIRGNDMGSNAVGMAQKLLLFWRKPARRCWWEGVELEDVEGLPQGTKLKVWIRRVWTLEMSVIGLR